jgi:hypothetical protein
MAKRRITIDTETNIGRVVNLMESGSPLNQAFVIEAINQYARLCLQKDAAYFDSPMLHGQAWLDCAKRADAWSMKYYGRAD